MGVVPKDTPFLSNQSCKSVCPLAIANCKESRYVAFCILVNSQIVVMHLVDSVY